jgi:hypothetical protein
MNLDWGESDKSDRWRGTKTSGFPKAFEHIGYRNPALQWGGAYAEYTTYAALDDPPATSTQAFISTRRIELAWLVTS